MGNKILIQSADEVQDFHDPEIAKILQDMKSTMLEYKGVGIAAPQIGINKRIMMFGFESNARYPNEKPVPFEILANPGFMPLDNEIIYSYEGCLSVPGIRCQVQRYNNIKYTGYDLINHVYIEKTVSGFHARIVQHEIDHLNGFLILFRTDKITSASFESELK
ncbi:MAG: peptide deformylase [Gammaproteobacteria bacterium]|nr:peptide deformylase [Gammaproteobacteria bacterium]